MYENVCKELVGDHMYCIGGCPPVNEESPNLVERYCSALCPYGQFLSRCGICNELQSIFLKGRYSEEFLEAGSMKIALRPDIEAEINKVLATAGQPLIE